MKYFQKTIVIAILFLWYCHATAQVITGIVCDKATKLPVPDVHVYLDGTSINTITDASGKFELKTKSAINTKLVLHHLSYQTAIIDNPFGGLPDILYIEGRVRTIREVSIQADRFTREQKMKAFREQFLGVSRAGKSCIILNEDDIQLTVNMQTRRLLASSDNPIVVVNDYLGYKISFTLFDFWVQYGLGIVSLDNDYVHSSFFAVVSSFTDLFPDSRRIKRRRDSVYEISSNNFFKSLANNTLKDNRFIVFEKSFPINHEQYFSIKDTLSLKMISIIPSKNIDSKNDTYQHVPNDYEIRNDTVFHNKKVNRVIPKTNPNSGFPAMNDTLVRRPMVIGGIPNTNIDKEMMFYSGPKLSGKISVLYRRRIQSDIYFATDSFLVDRYGNINQISKISFSGQFGKNRAGDMLPIDYEPTPPETKQMSMTFKGSGTKTIYMSGTGTVTIDWGDGSASETHTLSHINEGDWGNFSSKYKFSHAYSATNTYSITITGVDITHLNCYNNQLTSLDISKNTDLKVLFCLVNQLNKLDVSNNIKLTELVCFDNPLTSLDLKKNTGLIKLSCGGNLSSLDVSKNTALIELDCSKNPLLTKLDLSNNNALVRLNCVRNQLTSLKISKDTELTSLQCVYNQLSADELNVLFGMLHSNITSSVKTIFIGNNPGTGTCDKNIATNKGWRVVTE